MAEKVLKVQHMDDYRNIGGVICSGMHLNCGKNGGIPTLEAECSNPYKQTAFTQMGHEPYVDFDSPQKSTCIEVASSSVFSDFKADNQSNGSKEVAKYVEERSSNEESSRYSDTENPRRSGQLALNETKCFLGMENIHLHTEKKQMMSQFQSDINGMGKFVECTPSECLKIEQVRNICEGRVLEVEDTLEVAGFASTERKAANQGGQGHQAHHPKSDEGLGRLQMPSRLVEYVSVETSRIELQRSEDLNQRLVGRDGTPRDPNDYENQLSLSFQREKSLHKEKEGIVTALEASELKTSEQSVKLRELENNLTRLNEQNAYLEKRCITADAKARESSSLLSQLQNKLDYTATELFEAKSITVQVNAMKLQLQGCEEELSHARAQGALAESSLRELKLREELTEKVEQGKVELEERLKWRNEQFQSLEEAHSKLRLQLEVKSSEWASERSGLVSDIGLLQKTLDSKECILRELQEQLQMVHRALSHEESRRKVLELEAAESRQVLEQATAGNEEAQITLETLMEEYSAEKSALRNSLGAKDRQLKDLQVKYVHIELEYNEVKGKEDEYQAWQSNHGEQQLQLLSMKEKMSCVVDAHENLRWRMKELEKDTDKDRRDLVKLLDQANDHLGSKDETIKELDSELDRVKGALGHAQSRCSSLDIQLKQCESHLKGACEEAATARQALSSLENNSRAEKPLLLQSIHEKDKVIQDLKNQIRNMHQTIAELSLHGEERLLIQKDYEKLQQRENQREAGRKELEVRHRSLLLRVRQDEDNSLVDREKLLRVLQVTEERVEEVQRQLNEAHYRNERHLDVIRKLEARCALHDDEVARHCLLDDQVREQLTVGRTEVEKQRETGTLNQSHSSASGEKLKDRIGALEARLRPNGAETIGRNENVEKGSNETAEVLCNMEEHITVLKSQPCETANELNLSEHVRTNLEAETKTCQEESLAAKADLERKLEGARRDFSILSMQLKGATRQLLEARSQKELVLKDLDSKENFLRSLTGENKTLLAGIDSLEQVVHVLETKEAGLLQEVVSSTTIIAQLVKKYEAAQSNLASSLKEAKTLQAKIHVLRVQLLKAEEQIRDLEGYLKAAKAIAHDKEEKLAASEWAVQQLALDVGKAKAALSQKDREEGAMRDELADVERQLREKEGALIEMECYLEDALMSRESMQRELDRLRQHMQDLDKGAADWKRKEQDMTTQLKDVEAALEEKRAALAACELEIKRGHDLREVMDGAIDCLKLQLAGELKTASAQQKDMNRLCEDLERSRSEANSASGLVKELRGRFQQLEHSSAVRISHVQSSLFELKEELSVAHHQLEQYQDSTRLLTEESSRNKEKCEALLDLNTRKDSSLKDMEAHLFSVRRTALEQSKLLEQRDQDLQRAKEQLNSQDYRHISFQDSLSRIQSQKRELQLDKEKLLVEFRKLRVQLIVSSTEVSLKSKEILSLQIQLEQMKFLSGEGETQTSTIALVDGVESFYEAVQECEVGLCAMQASLHEALEKALLVQGILVGKEIDTEKSMEKWYCTENTSEDIQKGLSQLQEALTLTQSTLSKKSEIISLHMCAINSEEEKASWKDKAGSGREANSFNQELRAAFSLAMGRNKGVLTIQETLWGITLELRTNTKNLFYFALPEKTQIELKECKEKSAVAIEELFALTATSKGARVKALAMDMPLRSLQAALENAEDKVCRYDVLIKNLQGKISPQRVNEIEGRHLERQLKVTHGTAELCQVCDSQEFLEKSDNDLKKKKHQNLCCMPSFSSLQDKWLTLKSSVAAAEKEVISLKVQLKDAEDKRLQRRQEAWKVNEAIIAMEHDLIEERGNAQLITMLELDVNEERMKVADFTSLISCLRAQVEQWEQSADYSEESKAKQEILLEHARIKDRRIVQRLPDDIIESVTSIADIQSHVEGWKAKARDAAKENEGVIQELKCAGSTISSLLLQIEAHQVVERDMKKRNDSLQVDMDLACEVALARKRKMEIFLHELQLSQDSEKGLLETLQMEHKRLIIDLEEGGGLDWTLEIDYSQKMHFQGPRNTYNIRAAKFGTRDDEIRPNFHVERCQISAEDRTLGGVQETLEKELEILKLHAEDSQRQAHELGAKLDGALSDVTKKNLIIKQVNDEILGLRSLVKKLEQETRPPQPYLHGESQQCSTDTSGLTRGRDDRQHTTGPAKRRAAIEEELGDYLEFCDSLVRKNLRLEKQLDGLLRKNRGLRRQIEELRMTGMASSDNERRPLDPADFDPELALHGFSLKTNRNVVKPAAHERMLSLKDFYKGKVLGEIDENAMPESLELCQLSRRPPLAPVR